MIALLALIAVVAVVVLVPMIATSVARAVAQGVARSKDASIDQDLVEARLVRIEEAIDAMALQIERLDDRQRALLGGDASRGSHGAPGTERREGA